MISTAELAAMVGYFGVFKTAVTSWERERSQVSLPKHTQHVFFQCFWMEE